MKASLLGLAGVFVTASLAFAQYPPYPCAPRPVAPDACGPGAYNTGPCGMVYGPNYQIRPPYAPFNGILPTPPWYTPPAPAGAGAGVITPEFPSHPYCRSPRDYFMYPQDRDQ